MYMKPFDGGAWRGVSRIENEYDLATSYDESGEMLMHLQKAVEPYDVFARSLTIGPETMVMNFRPDEPMHNRYAVDHDFLSPETGAEAVTIAQTVNAFFRWEFNSCEMLVQGREVLPIDYANACPDVAVTSLHYYFPWAMSRLLAWSAYCAAADRPARPHVEPADWFAIADDPDLSYEDKLVALPGSRRRLLRQGALPGVQGDVVAEPGRDGARLGQLVGVRRAAHRHRHHDVPAARARAVPGALPWAARPLDPRPSDPRVTPPPAPARTAPDRELDYRPLGSSGLMVSAVGVGCNAFGARIDAERTQQVVDAALDAGVTLFDTADVYGGEPGLSESLLGRALGSRRADVVVATKFGGDMRGSNGPDWGARGSRRYVRLAVEASLRRLGTDWIDLYQLHTPDPITPIAETLAALDELVTEGKVRYIGSSNLAGWQVVDADWTAHAAGLAPFVSAQNKYSLYDRSADADLIPACEHVGVDLLPYFPLAYGLLTGKYRRGEPAPETTRLASAREASRLSGADFGRIEALQRYAEARDVTILDVAVGGLTAQPFVGSVIAGATSGEQVRANVRASAWRPSEEDLEALDALTAWS